jgi:hypothetical protein
MEEGVAQPETWEKVLYLEEILSFENLWNIKLAFLKEAEAMSFTKQCKLFYELWRYEFPPPGSLSEAIPNFSPTRDARSDASFSTLGTLPVSNSAFRLGNLYQMRHQIISDSRHPKYKSISHILRWSTLSFVAWTQHGAFPQQ